jgi:hypothetical protein
MNDYSVSFAFEPWMIRRDSMPLHECRKSECGLGAVHPSSWRPEQRDAMYAEMDDPEHHLRAI